MEVLTAFHLGFSHVLCLLDDGLFEAYLQAVLVLAAIWQTCGTVL